MVACKRGQDGGWTESGDQEGGGMFHDGEILMWGNNSSGQLGLGDIEPRLVPTKVLRVTVARNTCLESVFLRLSQARAHASSAFCSTVSGLFGVGRGGVFGWDHGGVPVVWFNSYYDVRSRRKIVSVGWRRLRAGRSRAEKMRERNKRDML